MLTVHSYEYDNYIGSPAWNSKRMQRLQIDGGRCVMCGCVVGNGVAWETHHIHYKNLGHEDVMTDICTLCVDCHKKIHNYYDRRGGFSFNKNF